MFSSTAYEAFYTYIGIYLHEASIQVITSQSVLVAILMMIVGFSFLMGAWNFAKKAIPGLGGGKGGITFLFKITAYFMIGMMLLKVDVNQGVKNFERLSWHDNGYITSRLPSVNQSYRVSFIFDLLTRSAEEIGKFATEIVDTLFQKTNSQISAPDAFYRAVMYTGSQTIDDPLLRDEIDIYTRNCIEKILPLVNAANTTNQLNYFFEAGGVIDLEMDYISLQTDDGREISCYDLKQLVRSHLIDFARSKGETFRYNGKIGEYFHNPKINMVASAALVNHYLSKHEDSQGTHEGAKVEGTMASVLLRVKRFFSFDGFLNTIGKGDVVGSVLTADRAEQFAEYLQRAPHLKGMVKMGLIAVFPWLVFFVVAGKWRVLISWYVVYVSVTLWTPVWTLLYHLMTSIALSTELMGHFGMLNDGVSLYSSAFVTAKLYQFYAIYSWLQLICGPLPTLILGYGMFTSFLRDSESESAPAIVSDVTNAAASSSGVTPAAIGVALGTKGREYASEVNNNHSQGA